jgi:hypothetical protein
MSLLRTLKRLYGAIALDSDAKSYPAPSLLDYLARYTKDRLGDQFSPTLTEL